MLQRQQQLNTARQTSQNKSNSKTSKISPAAAAQETTEHQHFSREISLGAANVQNK